MGYRLLILGLLAATLLYLALARQIPLDPWSAGELINSRTLPTVYGCLLALTLTGMLFITPPGARYPTHGWQALALTALLAVFVGVVPTLGLWIATAGLLLAAMLILGERRMLPLLLLALGIPAGGWLLVEHWLGIYVPGVGA